MKSRLLIFTLIILSLLSVMPAGYAHAGMSGANDWKFFTESSLHKWFYDTKRIEHSKNNIIKVWTKSVAKGPASIEEKVRLLKKFGGSTWGYEKYSYTINLFEIDCRNKRHRLIMVEDYDSGDALLERAVMDSNVWAPIPAESVMESLYKATCPQE